MLRYLFRGILEVCEEDFTKSLTEAETAESSAQAEYDKVTQENKITKATKEQDAKLIIAENTCFS